MPTGGGSMKEMGVAEILCGAGLFVFAAGALAIIPSLIFGWDISVPLQRYCGGVVVSFLAGRLAG